MDDSALAAPLLPPEDDDHHSNNYNNTSGLIDVEDGTTTTPSNPPRNPLQRRRRSSTRLLDRAGTFRQSRGRWGVERLSRFDPSSTSARNNTDLFEDDSSYPIDHDHDQDDGNDNHEINRNRRQRRSAASSVISTSSNDNNNNIIWCCGCCCLRHGGNACCRRFVQCFRYCCPWCWWCFCRCGPIRQFAHQWGKDWFFFLAYQKTCVLFLLLFTAYSLIVCFFGFVYLALSIIGSKSEINPDGSTKTIAFCDMDINDHMEAMYFSLSTMTTYVLVLKRMRV
jgi:hypothetical protein